MTETIVDDRTVVDVDLDAQLPCEAADCPAGNPPAVARIIQHHLRCDHVNQQLICAACAGQWVVILGLPVFFLTPIGCWRCGRSHVCSPVLHHELGDL